MSFFGDEGGPCGAPHGGGISFWVDRATGLKFVVVVAVESAGGIRSKSKIATVVVVVFFETRLREASRKVVVGLVVVGAVGLAAVGVGGRLELGMVANALEFRIVALLGVRGLLVGGASVLEAVVCTGGAASIFVIGAAMFSIGVLRRAGKGGWCSMTNSRPAFRERVARRSSSRARLSRARTWSGGSRSSIASVLAF